MYKSIEIAIKIIFNKSHHHKHIWHFSIFDNL